jgi:hypothetical protein
VKNCVSVASCLVLSSLVVIHGSAQETHPLSNPNLLATTSPNTASSVTQVKPNTLLDGTPIRLRLGRTIASASEKVGNSVDFDVLEDVTVSNVVVIPKGRVALATVTSADHKKSMGRAGKLEVNIDSVRLADGEKAAMRATEGGKAGGHVGAMTGAIVATSIVFFPAAPLFLFIHGKDLVIPKGTEITAYVNGDMTLDMAKFLPPSPVAAPTTASLSQISIDANVQNCDIEVDGAFAGNTPSQLTLAPGKHEIAVTKNGFSTWSRTVMVSGSGVHLNAELEAVPANVSPMPGK